jgi:hypothetical protein
MLHRPPLINRGLWTTLLEKTALTLHCPTCDCGMPQLPCGPDEPACFDRLTAAGLLLLSQSVAPNPNPERTE